jgi:alanine-glyoxylate transaminase/serine-glyoxylate transaminase/serine-pyruvate transaminase
MPYQSGRHFLQIPGPTKMLDRILRAIDQPTIIDHRGPAFQRLGIALFEVLKAIFKTNGPVVIFPASGAGAWKAALVNTLSPGDQVLMAETGHFATLWSRMAGRLGLDVELIPSDWRHGVNPKQIAARLAEDRRNQIKAVCIVHNETPTGVTSRVSEVRKAIDRAKHPALFIVDTISSLASIDYRHDEWGVHVTVAGSQKGLMLPPGLSFNAISEKARVASNTAKLPRSYWSWEEMLVSNATGYFRYTPATNLLFGLREAITMLLEEGLDSVFARHDWHAEATRRGARLGPRDPLPRAARVFELADRASAAAHSRRGRLPQCDAQALRPLARQRARQAAGQVGSASVISVTSTTPHARRHAGRRRDGAPGCRLLLRGSRGGPRLSRRQLYGDEWRPRAAGVRKASTAVGRAGHALWETQAQDGGVS